MIELTQQTPSRNSLNYTLKLHNQTTPKYSPIYHPIPMSTGNNKINLASNQDEVPFRETSLNKEEKYKVKNHPPSVKKPSFSRELNPNSEILNRKYQIDAVSRRNQT